MKQYVLDQLRESDHTRILDYLNENADATAVEGVYFVNLPEHLYSEVQAEHSECHPYYFSVNLDFTRVCFELLIRSRERMRCSGIGYATREQRDHIIDFADSMLDRLGIRL